MNKILMARAGLCAVAFLLIGRAGLSQEVTVNQARLKTDLLVVTAHPDDESMMAATMARYADEGKVVSLVTATQGEGGGNGTGKESGKALGLVRDMELRECLRLLGTRHLYYLDQLDWAYTESVQATLNKWGKEESLRRLVRLVRLMRPEVICTMDPGPSGGQHGHHQAAGRLATEAFEAAADSKQFPELQTLEGLYPWRVKKLYWTSFGGPATLRMATDGIAKGKLAALHPGKRYADISFAAESNHRSQGFDKFMRMMMGSGQRPPARPEGFLLVKSRVRVNPNAEKDLFEGTDANVDGPATERDILDDMIQKPVATNSVEARIQPRENIRNYRDWLKAQGLSRLMTRLPANVTVVEGTESAVSVEITNHTGMSQSGKVTLEIAAGWKVKNAEQSYALPAHGTALVKFDVEVPAGLKVGSYDVSTRIVGASESAGDSGKLNLVPRLMVERLKQSFPVDGNVAKWESAGITPVAIPHTNTGQGSVRDANEASGRFFVGYDREAIQALIEVTDDTVVFNIPPDDIKGHWRSTSSEICLDPFPTSENTFTTLKLGMFPQDTTGRPRAARDADANPGPIDRSNDGIQLASLRTAKGYVLETRIPWKALSMEKRKVTPRSGMRFGFNVILFHAGKKDALPGEDVGKARLAWSFYPGVWGRPEVWGVAVLK